MKRAFTLIEVMVATAVLALGAVMIHDAFFLSLDTFNNYVSHLNVLPKADALIWQAQNALSRLGPEAALETSGELESGNNKFKWVLSYAALEEELFKVDLNVFWQQDSRDRGIIRTAYATYFKE